MQPPDLSITSVGHTSRKAPEAQVQLSPHPCNPWWALPADFPGLFTGIRGDTNALLKTHWRGPHLLPHPKFAWKEQTWHFQQPVQHRYRLQSDPRACTAFIHVQYGHQRSHKQGVHNQEQVPLSKRWIGQFCADTAGNKLFCFLKAKALLTFATSPGHFFFQNLRPARQLLAKPRFNTRGCFGHKWLWRHRCFKTHEGHFWWEERWICSSCKKVKHFGTIWKNEV